MDKETENNGSTVLAKPDGQDLISHIQDLLSQESLLLSTYPKIANIVSPTALSYISKLHDTGKANVLFQKK